MADLVALATVFAVATWVGQQHLAAGNGRAIVEWELSPAVMVACGEGFTRPAVESAALREFLFRLRPSVTCAEAVGDEQVVPLPIAQSERYAIIAAGVAMRVAGTSWQTLDAYLGALFGVTMMLAYGLLRQLVAPALAVAGTAALIWSSQVTALLSFRDFGKAPMFFAAWLLLAAVVRRGCAPGRSRLALMAAVAGAVIGVGLGFRTDLMVCVPAFVVAILFVIPGADLPAMRAKGLALALFAIALVASGWPVLRSASAGSNSSHVVVLGLMQTFTQELGLEAPAYDLGAIYSDTFGATLIAAHAGLVRHDRQPLLYGSAAYDAAGGALLTDAARHFPSDVLTRFLAATSQVLEAPFTGTSRGDYLRIAPLNASAMSRLIGRARDLSLRGIEGRSVWLAVVLLLVLSGHSWRLGVWSAAAVLYFAGYSMLQFSRRHTFHLDLIGIGICLFAVQLVLAEGGRFVARWRNAPEPGIAKASPQSRASGIVVVMALGVTVFAVLWGAREWQQGHVRTLLDTTLAIAWDEVAVTPEPLKPSLLLDGGVRPTWQPIAAGDLDRWSSGVLLRVPRPARPGTSPSYQHGQQTEYLRVELTSACRSGVVSVVTAYSGSEPTAFRDYTRLFHVAVSDGVEPSRLLVPVFYHDGPAWTTFDGIAVPGDQAACLAAVFFARVPESVPFPILSAVLTPDWRHTRWYQRRKTGAVGG